MKNPNFFLSVFLLSIFILVGCNSQKEEIAIPQKSNERLSPEMLEATDFFEKKEFEKAIAVTGRIITKGESDNEFSAALVLRGKCFSKTRKVEEAIEDFKQVISISEKPTKALGVAHHEYGTILFLTGKQSKGKNELEKALGIKEQVFEENDLEIAKTCYNLGQCYGHFEGNYRKVIEFHERALQIRATNPDQERYIAKMSISLGAAYFRIGNLIQAKKYWEEGYFLFESLSDSISMSQILNNSANVELEIGNLNTAQEQFQSVLKLIKNDISTPIYPVVQFNLARIAGMRGDADLSLSYLERAINSKDEKLKTDIHNIYNIRAEFAKVFNNLKKEPEKALPYLFDALELIKAKAGENHPAIYLAYQDIGSIYLALKQPQTAKEYFLKSLQNPQKETISLSVFSNLGKAEAQLGNNLGAIQWHEKSITHAEEIFGNGSIHAAERKINFASFLEQENINKNALSILEEGLEKYTSDFIFSKENIGKLDLKSILDPLLLLNGLETRGNIFKKEFEKEKQIDLLENSFISYVFATETISKTEDIISSENAQIKFKEDAKPVFEKAIALGYELFQLTRNEEIKRQIFALSEQYKASVLKKTIRKGTAKIGDKTVENLLDKERDLIQTGSFLENKIAEEAANPSDSVLMKSLKIQLSENNIQLAENKKTLEETAPKLYKYVNDSDDFDFEKLQKIAIEENSVIIEYFSGKNSSYGFAISESGLKVVELNSDLIDLETDLENLLNLIKNRPEPGDLNASLKSFHQHSRNIYSQILKPFENEIAADTNLLIIPDGNLFYLPFEILLTENSIALAYDRLPYLFKTKNIRYEYSTAIMAENQNQQSKGKGYFGFAPKYKGGELIASADEKTRSLYPEIVRDGLANLIFNRDEVKDAAEHLEGKSFVDSSATERNFKVVAEGAGVLHLAMHALTNDIDPLYSQLVFNESTDTVEDGKLHAYELYNMNLNADLAVLSACNTGAGKLQKGEGVMSLSRAFKYAGCPNIVMSLWQANDASTGMLMDRFFKNLKAGKGKSKALNEARKNYLSRQEDGSYTHPFYWANFVLIGDNEPIVSSSFDWIWKAAFGFVILFVMLFFKRKNSIQFS